MQGVMRPQPCHVTLRTDNEDDVLFADELRVGQGRVRACAMQRAVGAVDAQGLERRAAMLAVMFLVMLAHVEDVAGQSRQNLVAFFHFDTRGGQERVRIGNQPPDPAGCGKGRIPLEQRAHGELDDRARLVAPVLVAGIIRRIADERVIGILGGKDKLAIGGLIRGNHTAQGRERYGVGIVPAEHGKIVDNRHLAAVGPAETGALCCDLAILGVVDDDRPFAVLDERQQPRHRSAGGLAAAGSGQQQRMGGGPWREDRLAVEPHADHAAYFVSHRSCPPGAAHPHRPVPPDAGPVRAPAGMRSPAGGHGCGPWWR